MSTEADGPRREREEGDQENKKITQTPSITEQCLACPPARSRLDLSSLSSWRTAWPSSAQSVLFLTTRPAVKSKNKVKNKKSSTQQHKMKTIIPPQSTHHATDDETHERTTKNINRFQWRIRPALIKMADWSRQRQARFAQSKPAVGAQNPRSLVLVMSMKWRVWWSLCCGPCKWWISCYIPCTPQKQYAVHGQRTGLYGGHVYAQSEAIAGIAGNVAQRSDAGFQPNCNSLGLSSMLNQSGLYYSRPRWDGDGSNHARFAHPTHAPSIQYQGYYHWVCPLFIYRIAYAISPF